MRTGTVFAALAAALFFLPAAHAWEISKFQTDIIVHQDSAATITETITADFGYEQKHGIYRDIPLHAADSWGQHFKTRLVVEAVTDENARPLTYKISNEGPYIRIRIGDANITLSGEHIYRIIYRVERGAVRFFPDHDELYWNMTGNEWAVPIRRAEAIIQLPGPAQKLRAIAYIGLYGSTETVRNIQQVKNNIFIEPERGLSAYEGLTAAVSWAKGAVVQPSQMQQIIWWIADNWVYGIPVFIFIFMFLLWNVKGRDPHLLRKAEVVEYTPPDQLSPAEMGALWDERVDMHDITASVIDLAVRGFIRIEEKKASLLGFERVADYTLVSLKDWDKENLRPFEKDLLEGVFSRPGTSKKLSDLQEVFYSRIPRIHKHLFEELVKGKYIAQNPERVRAFYFSAAVFSGFTLLFALRALASYTVSPPSAFLVAILSALIIGVFGHLMPRRSLKGAKTAQQIRGFVEFLRRTDEDKVKRMNDPSLFEKCLPYAMAFGFAEQWARAFQGLYTQPPSWYVGSSNFSTTGFSRGLNSAASSMGKSFASAPRSSSSSGFGGGGFSGGGGGGGGGGSW